MDVTGRAGPGLEAPGAPGAPRGICRRRRLCDKSVGMKMSHAFVGVLVSFFLLFNHYIVKGM